MDHVLFVCTGNLCRSPIAEALLRRRLADRGIVDVVVSSAGTMGLGSRATPEAREAAAERGGDLSEHRARRLDAGLVASADLVVAMTADHVIDLVYQAPDETSRIFKLSEIARLARDAEPRRLDEELRPYAERLSAGRSEKPWVDSRTDVDVDDPMGTTLDVYRETAESIDTLLGDLVDGAWPI